MDLILCRNVLIYFDADTVAAVAHRLLASLSEDGWLFLGASDPPLTDLVPCTVVQTGNGVAYRRAGHVAPRRKAPPPPPEVAPPSFVEPAPALPDELQADVPDILPPPSAIRGEAVHAPGEREGERGDDERWALRVRALADEGRLEEAGRLCAGGLDRHRLSGELAILHSLLLAEAGRAGEAAAAARRALYLDRGLVMAHLAQARALARLDDQAGARRSLENARRLLAALPADAIVPASGGERAGHLIGAVRVQLRLYGGAS
jgi:chemotaxis protein methyltransferase CheR